MAREPSGWDGRVTYDGDRTRLTGVFLASLALSIPTLGLFAPWGLARWRRMIWSSVAVAGHRAAYDGTGLGILLVWLVNLSILAALAGAVGLVAVALEAGTRPMVALMSALALVPLGLFGWAVGRYRAQRHAARHTLWRGHRLDLRGSALGFGARATLGVLATVASLGLAWPLARAWTARYRLRHLSVGGRPLTVTGAPWRTPHGPFLLRWGGAALILAVGGVALWPLAEAVQLSRITVPRSEAALDAAWTELALVAAGTAMAAILAWALLCWDELVFPRALLRDVSLDGVRFASSARFGDLLARRVLDIGYLLVSLGLLWPVVEHRRLGFHARRLRFRREARGEDAPDRRSP